MVPKTRGAEKREQYPMAALCLGSEGSRHGKIPSSKDLLGKLMCVGPAGTKSSTAPELKKGRDMKGKNLS